MGLKDTLENHIIIVVCGVAIAAFGTGIGAAEWRDAGIQETLEQKESLLKLKEEALQEKETQCIDREKKARVDERKMGLLGFLDRYQDELAQVKNGLNAYKESPSAENVNRIEAHAAAILDDVNRTKAANYDFEQMINGYADQLLAAVKRKDYAEVERLLERMRAQYMERRAAIEEKLKRG